MAEQVSKKLTILLVDDEFSYRMLMGDTLENEGWKVVTAENGEEALKKMAETKFDIVISDVYMPVMDGLRFHATLRANPEFKKIPFLFVSAHDDPYTTATAKSTRCDAFIKKTRPFSELKEWVLYLISPFNKKPPASPLDIPSSSNENRLRDRSRPPRR